MQLRAHFQYLRYVLRHKWYVFIGCLKFGAPLWLGIIHDLSKFLPNEWFSYVRYFYHPDGTPKGVRDQTGHYKPGYVRDKEFGHACFNHISRNKHHWQRWVLPNEGGHSATAFPIPDKYIREMLADWFGAGMAQNGLGDVKKWYNMNKDKILLHEETKKWVEMVLERPYIL